MDENTLPPVQTTQNILEKPLVSQNPVEELIQMEKKNTELLSDIAQNQALLLELTKENKRSIKINRRFVVLKYVFWIVAIYASFVVTQNIMENMLNEIPSVSGGMDILNSQDTNISDVLKGFLGK